MAPFTAPEDSYRVHNGPPFGLRKSLETPKSTKRISSVLFPLQEALKLPKQTPEEKAARDQALQAGLQKAVAVPYNLAMEVNRLWPAMVQLATVGNLTTISDLQVGSQLAA